MTIQVTTTKKLLLASLATIALTLSACADPDSATTQDDVDAIADPQTEIEQEATGVDDVAQATENVNSADISDEPMAVDATAEDDIAVVTADEVADADIMDGSAEEEHVSTY